MRKLTTQQPTLFAPTPPLSGLPMPQRASALELLRVLLTEAMHDPAVGVDVPEREEIGDDQDHP